MFLLQRRTQTITNCCVVVALNKINCCCFENIILLDFFVVHLLLITLVFVKRRDTCFFCLLELFSDKFYLNFFFIKKGDTDLKRRKKFEYKSTHVIQENIISFSSLTFFNNMQQVHYFEFWFLSTTSFFEGFYYRLLS